MHEGHRNRALTDRERNPLDVSAANVADRKDAGNTRLEQMRRSCEWPMGPGQIIAREIGPGLDKTSWIEREAAGDPPRIGNVTNTCCTLCVSTSPDCVSRQRTRSR